MHTTSWQGTRCSQQRCDLLYQEPPQNHPVGNKFTAAGTAVLFDPVRMWRQQCWSRIAFEENDAMSHDCGHLTSLLPLPLLLLRVL